MDMFSGDVNKMLEDVKLLAIRISSGDCQTEKECGIYFANILSEYYKIPLFSEYFKNLTMYEMMFEVEMVKIRNMTKNQKIQEVMNSPEAQDEIDHLFDDLEANNPSNWKPTDDIPKADPIVDDFFKTGKFVGE
jgi:hypothetical protein